MDDLELAVRRQKMFSQADRLPAQESEDAALASVRPWGLLRMSNYTEVVKVPYCSARLDPKTQTGLYFDGAGNLVEMKHRKTNRSTEQKTRVSKGDGNSPSRYDDDTVQDSETD
jgi:putative ATP-grasp target RiPP